MKTKILLVAVFLLFIVTASFTQEKSKKQLKEEAKIEKQKHHCSLGARLPVLDRNNRDNHPPTLHTVDHQQLRVKISR